MFLVPKEAPGLSLGKKERKMGYGGSPTCELVFDDCVVSTGALLGQEGYGFSIAMKGLDRGSISTGAMALGPAQCAFEEAAEYARTSVHFGRPISQFQGIRWMLVDMAMEIEAFRLLVHRAASLCGRSLPFTKEAAMAKCYANDMAMRVSTDTVQIFGGHGYIRDYPAKRHMRDVKFMQIVEETNQI